MMEEFKPSGIKSGLQDKHRSMERMKSEPLALHRRLKTDCGVNIRQIKRQLKILEPNGIVDMEEGKVGMDVGHVGMDADRVGHADKEDCHVGMEVGSVRREIGGVGKEYGRFNKEVGRIGREVGKEFSKVGKEIGSVGKEHGRGGMEVGCVRREGGGISKDCSHVGKEVSTLGKGVDTEIGRVDKDYGCVSREHWDPGKEGSRDDKELGRVGGEPSGVQKKVAGVAKEVGEVDGAADEKICDAEKDPSFLTKADRRKSLVVGSNERRNQIVKKRSEIFLPRILENGDETGSSTHDSHPKETHHANSLITDRIEKLIKEGDKVKNPKMSRSATQEGAISRSKSTATKSGIVLTPMGNHSGDVPEMKLGEDLMEIIESSDVRKFHSSVKTSSGNKVQFEFLKENHDSSRNKTSGDGFRNGRIIFKEGNANLRNRIEDFSFKERKVQRDKLRFLEDLGNDVSLEAESVDGKEKMEMLINDLEKRLGSSKETQNKNDITSKYETDDLNEKLNCSVSIDEVEEKMSLIKNLQKKNTTELTNCQKNESSSKAEKKTEDGNKEKTFSQQHEEKTNITFKEILKGECLINNSNKTRKMRQIKDKNQNVYKNRTKNLVESKSKNAVKKSENNKENNHSCIGETKYLHNNAKSLNTNKNHETGNEVDSNEISIVESKTKDLLKQCENERNEFAETNLSENKANKQINMNKNGEVKKLKDISSKEEKENKNLEKKEITKKTKNVHATENEGDNNNTYLKNQLKEKVDHNRNNNRSREDEGMTLELQRSFALQIAEAAQERNGSDAATRGFEVLRPGRKETRFQDYYPEPYDFSKWGSHQEMINRYRLSGENIQKKPSEFSSASKSIPFASRRAVSRPKNLNQEQIENQLATTTAARNTLTSVTNSTVPRYSRQSEREDLERDDDGSLVLPLSNWCRRSDARDSGNLKAPSRSGIASPQSAIVGHQGARNFNELQPMANKSTFQIHVSDFLQRRNQAVQQAGESDSVAPFIPLHCHQRYIRGNPPKLPLPDRGTDKYGSCWVLRSRPERNVEVKKKKLHGHHYSKHVYKKTSNSSSSSNRADHSRPSENLNALNLMEAPKEAPNLNENQNQESASTPAEGAPNEKSQEPFFTFLNSKAAVKSKEELRKSAPVAIGPESPEGWRDKRQGSRWVESFGRHYKVWPYEETGHSGSKQVYRNCTGKNKVDVTRPRSGMFNWIRKKWRKMKNITKQGFNMDRQCQNPTSRSSPTKYRDCNNNNFPLQKALKVEKNKTSYDYNEAEYSQSNHQANHEDNLTKEKEVLEEILKAMQLCIQSLEKIDLGPNGIRPTTGPQLPMKTALKKTSVETNIDATIQKDTAINTGKSVPTLRSDAIRVTNDATLRNRDSTLLPPIPAEATSDKDSLPSLLMMQEWTIPPVNFLPAASLTIPAPSLVEPSVAVHSTPLLSSSSTSSSPEKAHETKGYSRVQDLMLKYDRSASLKDVLQQKEQQNYPFVLNQKQNSHDPKNQQLNSQQKMSQQQNPQQINQERYILPQKTEKESENKVSQEDLKKLTNAVEEKKSLVRSTEEICEQNRSEDNCIMAKIMKGENKIIENSNHEDETTITYEGHKCLSQEENGARTRRRSACFQCNGKGQIPVMDAIEWKDICILCGGERNSDLGECSSCQGTGHTGISKLYLEQTCDACLGTGVSSNKNSLSIKDHSNDHTLKENNSWDKNKQEMEEFDRTWEAIRNQRKLNRSVSRRQRRHSKYSSQGSDIKNPFPGICHETKPGSSTAISQSNALKCLGNTSPSQTVPCQEVPLESQDDRGHISSQIMQENIPSQKRDKEEIQDWTRETNLLHCFDGRLKKELKAENGFSEDRKEINKRRNFRLKQRRRMDFAAATPQNSNSLKDNDAPANCQTPTLEVESLPMHRKSPMGDSNGVALHKQQSRDIEIVAIPAHLQTPSKRLTQESNDSSPLSPLSPDSLAFSKGFTCPFPSSSFSEIMTS